MIAYIIANNSFLYVKYFYSAGNNLHDSYAIDYSSLSWFCIKIVPIAKSNTLVITINSLVKLDKIKIRAEIRYCLSWSKASYCSVFQVYIYVLFLYSKAVRDIIMVKNPLTNFL